MVSLKCKCVVRTGDALVQNHQRDNTTQRPQAEQIGLVDSNAVVIVLPYLLFCHWRQYMFYVLKYSPILFSGKSYWCCDAGGYNFHYSQNCCCIPKKKKKGEGRIYLRPKLVPEVRVNKGICASGNSYTNVHVTQDTFTFTTTEHNTPHQTHTPLRLHWTQLNSTEKKTTARH